MEEVFSNLITNAIKYSPAGGTITISAATENEYLKLQVTDTGFGIASEDLEKIFTRFYRVKDSNTRQIQGTGLGLSIVKSIIESHHGKISATSEMGKGTTFTVLLPFRSTGIAGRSSVPFEGYTFIHEKSFLKKTQETFV